MSAWRKRSLVDVFPCTHTHMKVREGHLHTYTRAGATTYGDDLARNSSQWKPVQSSDVFCLHSHLCARSSLKSHYQHYTHQMHALQWNYMCNHNHNKWHLRIWADSNRQWRGGDVACHQAILKKLFPISDCMGKNEGKRGAYRTASI